MAAAKRRVLLDACLPVDFRHHLPSHDVVTARYRGWQTYRNGQLLDAAETEFDVLVTVDSNLVSQQKLAGRRLAIVAVSTTSNRLDDLLPLADTVDKAAAEVAAGQFVRVSG